MNTISLLLTDYLIPKEKTEQRICEELGLQLFDFRIEFSNQMKLSNHLTNKINSYLLRGELVPTILITNFLKTCFSSLQKKKILLTNYPRTIEQFLDLIGVLTAEQLIMDTIWYLRVDNPELEFQNIWKSKYPQSETSVSQRKEEWKQKFENKREEISNIKSFSEPFKWNEVLWGG